MAVSVCVLHIVCQHMATTWSGKASQRRWSTSRSQGSRRVALSPTPEFSMLLRLGLGQGSGMVGRKVGGKIGGKLSFIKTLQGNNNNYIYSLEY